MLVPTPSAIETVNGTFIDLLNPDPADVNIDDIAWALSRMPRYMAHTVSLLPYTIGQHSIACVDLAIKLRDGDPDLTDSFLKFLSSKSGIKREDLTFDASAITQSDLLHVLLHDASEAYIVDVPTPLKQIQEFEAVYRKLEDRMMGVIYQAVGLEGLQKGSLTQWLVSWADVLSLSIEAYHLMKTRGKDWTRLIPVPKRILLEFAEPALPVDVYTAFNKMFNTISAHHTALGHK